jgi:hypothetical protein
MIEFEWHDVAGPHVAAVWHDVRLPLASCCQHECSDEGTHEVCSELALQSVMNVPSDAVLTCSCSSAACLGELPYDIPIHGMSHDEVAEHHLGSRVVAERWYGVYDDEQQGYLYMLDDAVGVPVPSTVADAELLPPHVLDTGRLVDLKGMAKLPQFSGRDEHFQEWKFRFLVVAQLM